MSVSEIFRTGPWGRHYQHFYTGAFISEGYPAKRIMGWEAHILYYMAFGGLPSNTYTTVTLHSSPSLLLEMIVIMYQSGEKDLSQQFLGFSTELHTPISVYTDEGNAVRANGYHRVTDADTLYPALLLSFKG